jgi:hypothetical protein
LNGVQEVAGSNPVAPTNSSSLLFLFQFDDCGGLFYNLPLTKRRKKECPKELINRPIEEEKGCMALLRDKREKAGRRF